MTGARQPLVLVAASGLAREVIATQAARDQFEVLGVLDDDSTKHGASLGPTTVLGGLESASAFPSALFVVCAGRGLARESIVRRLSDMAIGPDRFATVVDSTAVIPPGCSVGAGSVVLSHVSLTADVTVGQHVVVMPQAVLTHDNRIDDFATICAGVVLGGNVHVGAAAYLGMNASVRQDLNIGRAATVGMGSVVLHDVPDARTWAGVPAVDLAGRGLERSFTHKGQCDPAVAAGGLEGALRP